jgi:hypothetical protein
MTKSTVSQHRVVDIVLRLALTSVAGFVAIIDAFALMRATFDARGVPMLRVALIAVAIFAGWWALDYLARPDLAAEQRALEARELDLARSALAPGSALACLDAIAGDVVEDACEKALFASPEATAAAVSYVAAQLSLLALASDRERLTAPSLRTAQLRRAVEVDRFGITAHVLAVRDGCTLDRCLALALLHDASRVSTNLVEQPFDALVRRYAAGWPADGSYTAANNSLPAATAAAPGTAPKSPNNLYFPSSASIPQVNIMTAEPAGSRPRDTTGTTQAASPPRKPAPGVSQTHKQAGHNASSARLGLTQLAPAR